MEFEGIVRDGWEPRGLRNPPLIFKYIEGRAPSPRCRRVHGGTQYLQEIMERLEAPPAASQCASGGLPSAAGWGTKGRRGASAAAAAGGSAIPPSPETEGEGTQWRGETQRSSMHRMAGRQKAKRKVGFRCLRDSSPHAFLDMCER